MVGVNPKTLLKFDSLKMYASARELQVQSKSHDLPFNLSHYFPISHNLYVQS